VLLSFAQYWSGPRFFGLVHGGASRANNGGNNG
jgi:hypothetical protein